MAQGPALQRPAPPRFALALALATVMSAAAATPPHDFAAERARMASEVEAMVRATRGETGVRSLSPAVRAALERVERHRLVPPSEIHRAYRNHPLPIGSGQTISQPYIVALSTELLAPQPEHVVLDVGTGSGYQAAMLAGLVARVHSIEILPELAHSARVGLADLGYANVEVRVGDGYLGWPEAAPFDGIVVAAAAPQVPAALVAQLKPGGRLVVPVGPPGGIQFLMLVTRRADGGADLRRVLPVRFVPLVPGPQRGG